MIPFFTRYSLTTDATLASDSSFADPDLATSLPEDLLLDLKDSKRYLYFLSIT